MSILNNIITLIGSSVILIVFIFSLLKFKNNKDYMRTFSFCILIALIVSINTICGRMLNLYPTSIFSVIQNIFILLDLTCWGLFFLRLLKDKSVYHKIKNLFIFSLAIAISFLCYNGLTNSNIHVLALLNICKTIFCLFFYLNLLKNVADKNLLLEPCFWVVTGLLFYSCLSLPFYALRNYIILEFQRTIADNIFSISNILVIIMYLFFIKAYTCNIQVHKV